MWQTLYPFVTQSARPPSCVAVVSSLGWPLTITHSCSFASRIWQKNIRRTEILAFVLVFAVPAYHLDSSLVSSQFCRGPAEIAIRPLGDMHLKTCPREWPEDLFVCPLIDHSQLQAGGAASLVGVLAFHRAISIYSVMPVWHSYIYSIWAGSSCWVYIPLYIYIPLYLFCSLFVLYLLDLK